MLSSQQDQQTRLEVQENDRRVRAEREERERKRQLREPDKPSTMYEFTHDEVAGRFAQVESSTVVGRDNPYPYPAASPSWQIQLPDEPPLGLDNPALEINPSLEPPTVSFAQGTTDPTERDPSSPLDVERGSPLSHKDDDAVKLVGGRTQPLAVLDAASSSPIRRMK